MQIGQLSIRTGVSVRMLRYYERDGLLHPERTATGYRRYGEDDVAIVKRIVLMNRAGLKLATIRDVLSCALPRSPGSVPCQALRNKARDKLDEMDRQIAELQESRKLLAALAGSR